MISAEAQLLKQKVIANKEAVVDETRLLNASAEQLRAQGKNVSNVEDPANVNIKNTESLITALGGQASAIDATLNSQLALITTNSNLQGEQASFEASQIEKRIENLVSQGLLENELNAVKKKQILDELAGIDLILTSKLENLTEEERLVRENAVSRLEALGFEKEEIQQILKFARERAEYELSFRKRFDSAVGASADTLETKTISSLNELNSAFVEGSLTFDLAKNKFSEFAGSLIKDIQKIFFQETIAKPAAGFLKDTFLGSEKEGGGIFSSLFGMGKNVNGGLIRHMASGGMARDRVPTLLEPGEFVVRKQAAKVAGPSNLASLNATGQMGGGNVSVNVTNTGTPQTAEASQPRFDGEKMVIDIVMRDLSTNGPIRRSLRAGGAS